MHFTAASAIFLASVALAAPSAEVSPRYPNIDNLLPPKVQLNTRANDAATIEKLLTSVTEVERAKILTLPGDYAFDFNQAIAPTGAAVKGKGGAAVSANAKTFPALIGNNIAMTVAFLGPCGMNTPHIHPRAAELSVVVKGRLVTNMVQENGIMPVANILDTFQMALFPKGSIHTEFNPDCGDTVFVAGLNSADPGVQSIAPNFFSLRSDVLGATLGGLQTFDGKDIETFRKSIPAGIAEGIDACLDKCGIKRNAKRDLGEFLSARSSQ